MKECTLIDNNDFSIIYFTHYVLVIREVIISSELNHEKLNFYCIKVYMTQEFGILTIF